ncbi:alkyl sulfatase C-terminal domain-containing protein [Methanobacterium petrolearium]|nr:hypothetical protein GCM10025861_00690 [Methanobacterium petrolearium]
MPTELLLEFLGILIDKDKAEGKEIRLNVNLTDRNEKCSINLVDSVLIYRMNYQDESPDIELNVDVSTLVTLILGQTKLDEVTSDESKVKGNSEDLKEFLDSMVGFDSGFNIVIP